MAWTVITRNKRGYRLGATWDSETPCIGMSTNVVRLNAAALATLGLSHGDAVVAMYDPKTNALGLRTPKNEDEPQFTILEPSSETNADGGEIKTTIIPRMFPNNTGRVYYKAAKKSNVLSASLKKTNAVNHGN